MTDISNHELEELQVLLNDLMHDDGVDANLIDRIETMLFVVEDYLGRVPK